MQGQLIDGVTGVGNFAGVTVQHIQQEEARHDTVWREEGLLHNDD